MQADPTISRKRRLPRARWVLLSVCVIAAALAISFVIRQQGAAKTAAADQSSPVFSVATAKVAEGQITTSVTYAADVKATNQVSVVPKGTGRIERLAVDVGSRVKKGDTIAELDADSLRAQVAQAKANLAAAKAKYSGMQGGPRDESVAQAKAALDSAQARLDTVKKGATESALQTAQGQLNTARANLQKAKAAQETVKLGPTQSEMAAAKAAVDAAKLSIVNYQAALDDLKAGPKDAELWAAQKDVESARSNLYSINDKVTIWKGTSTDAEKMATGYPSVSAAVEASGAAQTALDAAVARLNQLKAGATAAQLQDAQTKLMTAKSQYDSASAKLEQLQRGSTPQDLQQADAGVQVAEAALATAEASLKQLQDGPTAEDVRVAEAAVAQAEQAYNLAMKPYTQNDLGQAAASVQQAESAVELAEIGLREAVVKSPTDAVVAEKLQSEGALVSPATPIVTLVSGDVELALSVEESKVGQLKEGQKAEINATAYPGEAILAAVSSISPTADAKSRTFQVKVRPTDQSGKLRPGMFAQVKIATSEKPKALTVPKDALVNRGGQTIVFVVNGDTVQQRTVTTGIIQNGTAEITNGLSAGEEVVTAGQNDLKDGSQIKKG
ncbi:MAG TPA: efflux RND transporter periplasmic adaptor subunit [Chloroflexota bacterium]|nr:efflux RND transporter periplasmic adaptor subunit [Chloroflexota bacterium]